MRGISTVDDPICSTSRMQLRVWKARQSEAQMNFPHSTKHRRNLNHDIIELQHQSKQRMQQGCTSYERIGTLHSRHIPESQNEKDFIPGTGLVDIFRIWAMLPALEKKRKEKRKKMDHGMDLGPGYYYQYTNST